MPRKHERYRRFVGATVCIVAACAGDEPDAPRGSVTVAAQQVTAGDIKRRAIVVAADRAFSESEREQLEAAVAVERDETYVRAHLEKRQESGVSEATVQSFYRDNPERFGGRVEKICDVLTTERPLNDAEQAKLKGVLSDPAAHPDWTAWAAELKVEGFPVTFRPAVSDLRMHPSLREESAKLAEGATSQARVVLGSPFILRVVKIERTEPKPYAEVAPEIRRMLAPTELSKAVERFSARALKDADVKYFDSAKEAL